RAAPVPSPSLRRPASIRIKARTAASTLGGRHPIPYNPSRPPSPTSAVPQKPGPERVKTALFPPWSGLLCIVFSPRSGSFAGDHEELTTRPRTARLPQQAVKTGLTLSQLCAAATQNPWKARVRASYSSPSPNPHIRYSTLLYYPCQGF